jgi:hypothetical protein
MLKQATEIKEQSYQGELPWMLRMKSLELVNVDREDLLISLLQEVMDSLKQNDNVVMETALEVRQA